MPSPDSKGLNRVIAVSVFLSVYMHLPFGPEITLAASTLTAARVTMLASTIASFGGKQVSCQSMSKFPELEWKEGYFRTFRDFNNWTLRLWLNVVLTSFITLLLREKEERRRH